MSSISPERAAVRARIAANKRHHPNRPELVKNDLTRLRELALAEHIRRVVDEFPPLSDDQRNRLAALLRPTAHGGEQAA